MIFLEEVNPLQCGRTFILTTNILVLLMLEFQFTLVTLKNSSRCFVTYLVTYRCKVFMFCLQLTQAAAPKRGQS